MTKGAVCVNWRLKMILSIKVFGVIACIMELKVCKGVYIYD